MEFYGLLGEKLSHSLSPKIHDLILKKVGIRGGYKLFEVERNNLEDFS
ncbi:MAG: shikimate dehydrogenase, partial [Bacilli bacterium]